LQTVAGENGFGRPISWGRIQRPGLALAGFQAFIKPGRIQILGESELNYLDTMPLDVRAERIAAICALPVAAFVVTKGQPVPEDLARECRLREVPLLLSDRTTSVVIQSITRILEDELAPSTTVHGVLVDVYGMGVLLLGESGIGKSECALDLVYRGHRLIADDMVVIRRHPNDVLLGYSNDLLRHHMELRGIGIIDIKDLFGVASTRDVKPIDLVVRLEKWVEGTEYDRLGIAGETFELLGVSKPYVRLPVASGRNLALLVEIAARNHLMKLQGYDSAREFTRRIDEQIALQGTTSADTQLPATNREELKSSELRSMTSRTRFNLDVLDRTRRQR